MQHLIESARLERQCCKALDTKRQLWQCTAITKHEKVCKHSRTNIGSYVVRPTCVRVDNTFSYLARHSHIRNVKSLLECVSYSHRTEMYM